MSGIWSSITSALGFGSSATNAGNATATAAAPAPANAAGAASGNAAARNASRNAAAGAASAGNVVVPSLQNVPAAAAAGAASGAASASSFRGGPLNNGLPVDAPVSGLNGLGLVKKGIREKEVRDARRAGRAANKAAAVSANRGTGYGSKPFNTSSVEEIERKIYQGRIIKEEILRIEKALETGYLNGLKIDKYEEEGLHERLAETKIELENLKKSLPSHIKLGGSRKTKRSNKKRNSKSRKNKKHSRK